ncbi:MAG: protein translocase subunit SecD [Pirellulales bacterium]|nr:protein translocase subunit SecD [Pirellulales bacterium]
MMRNLMRVKTGRLGWAVSAMVVCITWGTLVGSAVSAEVLKASKGELKEFTDTTAVLEFAVTPADAENLEVAVFYDKEDGGQADDGWTKKPIVLKADKAKKPGEYSVQLNELDPNTVYFCRIKASSAAGTSWSEPAEFRTAKAAAPLHVMMLNFLLFFAMLVVPFVVGGWMANRWRMPDYGWKIGIIIFSLVWGIYFVSTQPLSLGIDLSGGVVLVYELKDEEQAKTPEEGEEPEPEAEEASLKEKMDKLVGAIALRVNPGGTREVTIRQYGPKQIEVTIPRANPEEVRRIREKISNAGELEFRILADKRDHRHREAIAGSGETEADTIWNADGSEKLGWWVPVESGEEDSFAGDDSIVTRTTNYRGKEVLEVLVVNDSHDVQGKYLSRCYTGMDDRGGHCVRFNFNREGAKLFGWLTGENTPDTVQNLYRKLGIILNHHLYSAPRINSVIHGNGEITGGFTEKEVKDLVDVLNAGSLPTALKKNPISELKSGPTLGRDTIKKGAIAIGLSLVVVLVFMVIYYRFAGLVACGALLMNLLLLLAIMIAVKADFTLPGIAGLVLTVGMAVDANVLIFERIREELAKNSALRMAIRNGFGRALSAIVDANLTTLITATLLWAIGTPQIKGFAVVLWLGVVLSMFTAIFCSRVVFDIGERRGWIKKLTMMHIIGNPNIDFVGLRKIGAAISVTLIMIGMVSVVARGKGLLDIDFTGGESVQILFKQPQRIAEIRKILGDAKDEAGKEGFPDLAVSDTQLEDEDVGLRFIINTSKNVGENESAIEIVEEDLHKIFGDKLSTNEMTIGTMTVIGQPSETKPVEPDAAEAKPKTDKPAENNQSRDDLPPLSLLASTDPAAVLLAQIEPPAEPGDEPTAKEPLAENDPKSATDAKMEPAKTPAAGKRVEAPTTPVPAPVRLQGRFEGGTKVDLHFAHELDHETIKDLITKQLTEANLNMIPFDLSNEIYEPGDTEAYQDWTLRIKLPRSDARTKVLEPIAAEMEATPFFPSSSSIGGKVAGDMQQKAIYTLLASLISIIGYLWIRFQRVMYGLAAVVALVHDVLITLGALAISAYLADALGFLGIEKFKISLPVLAAFLTIIGYSLNDTIVVFDRIREVKGKSPGLTADIINTSINQTLSRTLLTSLTTLIVVVILFIGGGTGLHAFAFALLVGVIVGTYSSIFVASPVLYWMSKPVAGPAKKS